MIIGSGAARQSCRFAKQAQIKKLCRKLQLYLREYPAGRNDLPG